MNDETIIKITAIVSLTAICIVSLTHGINSALTATVSAIIGGIAGYEIRGAVNTHKIQGDIYGCIYW